MYGHETVLLHEAVDALEVQPEDSIVDATLGSGGHTRVILSKLTDDGALIALDADPSAIEHASEVLRVPNVRLVHANFRHIDTVLIEQGIDGVDGILADLGWRAEQFLESGKGFSFQRDEPLHMTYGDPKDYPFTAVDIVNEWQQQDIENVLSGYGDERFSGRIARNIVEARNEARIETSGALAHIVERAVPTFYRHRKIHPATRTFQALRIAVNDELDALREFLRKSVNVLHHDGRLAVITFHSIEDRIVKHMFREFQESGIGIIVTKKPTYPSSDEIKKNTRSRSAKLRVFQKSDI